MGSVDRTRRAVDPPTTSAVVGDSSRNRGTTRAYSKRGRSSTRTSRVPSVHCARRRIAWWARTEVGSLGSNGSTGMQSVTSRVPVAVVNVVTSTFVPST
jgi:hypothetical protein